MRATKPFLTFLLPAAASLSLAQSVMVEEQIVTFDAAPKMVNGNFMVPIRPLFEAMGVDFRWRSDRGVIEGLKNGTKVEIWVGSSQARVNDKRRDMEVSPYVAGGRTYAPLKFIAAEFGYTISAENGNFVLREVKR